MGNTKKRDKGNRISKKELGKREAQEDLELADEHAQRVKGGAAIVIPKQTDKSSPILS
jgi:hypothetical protein